MKVGDILGVYTVVEKVGRTSVSIHVEAWARRDRIGVREKVNEAIFKFVAIDDNGKPTPLPREGDLPAYASDPHL